MTDWAIRLHAPTISFHLGTNERGRKENIVKVDGGDNSCLLMWDVLCKGEWGEKNIFIICIAIEKPEGFQIEICIYILSISSFPSSLYLWEVPKSILRFLIQLREE